MLAWWRGQKEVKILKKDWKLHAHGSESSGGGDRVSEGGCPIRAAPWPCRSNRRPLPPGSRLCTLFDVL